MTKLIILRGPSGSGKSTITNLLLNRTGSRFATIEQDMFRHKILHEQEGARELSAQMMSDTIKTALDNGYDVIAEGIFNIVHYKDMFDDLISYHQDDNFMYYFDVTFEETLRRHDTRSKKDDFREEEMRKWYDSASPAGYDFEKNIPESFSVDQTVNMILSDIK